MKIVMIGAGYVGLTTGTCLAEIGHEVCCVDVAKDKIEMLQTGRIPIYEPGLSKLIDANKHSGRLEFSADIAGAVSKADLVFIAVGTPSTEEGDIDLTYVRAAAEGFASHLRDEAIVVIKSTVVAGTAQAIRTLIAEKRGDDAIAVASNPEFLREGSAITDFMQADRIVVGADDERSAESLARLYKPLADAGITYIRTDTINAELIKYTANAFLALKIGFINDVANLCEKAGGDVRAIAEGIGLDRRIGESFLQAGPGFGGSCFPKDTRAFAATGRRFNAPQPLVETLIDHNELRKAALGERILDELGSDPAGKTVAVLGTAFKANTDDMREAPALTIIPLLQRAGVKVRAHDPKAQQAAARHLQDIHWCGSAYEAADSADALVILTEWEDYRTLDIVRIGRLLKGQSIIDYRNMLKPNEVVAQGLHYVSIGRAKASPKHTATKTNARSMSGAAPTTLGVAALPF
ncbi:UDP-glucose dehydrogenase family protein [Oryzifoliimicrobium ureilyticus]|uniref:UDP-glucose dehydrogenase family protein n=1 Tax=Oryzifoliimicrobium ureilyticus TaxID=3113724 RepID=UPI0030764FF9